MILNIKICNMVLHLPVLSCFDMCGGCIQTLVSVPCDLHYTAWCHTLRRAYLDEISSDRVELSLMFFYTSSTYMKTTKNWLVWWLLTYFNI